jgi:hypothetical protein
MGPMEHQKITRWLCGTLAVFFFLSHVVWAHAAESDFWSERAEMSRRMRNRLSPAVPGFLTRSPSIERLGPVNGCLPLGQEWASLLGQHGTVREVHLRSGPLVVYVQDVHGHRTAQENIAEIILSFLDRYPHAPVVLEGAAGPVSLDSGRGNSVASNRGAAAFFFNAGILSGAEYAVLAAPVLPSVYGGEDASLYRKNRSALDHAYLLKGSIEKRLTDWRKRVSVSKGSVFSEDLKELDRRLSRGKNGDGIVDRVAYLAETPRLPPPSAGSALGLFLQVSALEKSFSLKRVAHDRVGFIETLSQSLSPAETDDLAQTALAIRAGEQSHGSFYERLKILAERKGVSLQRFPDFNRYVRYVLLADQIRPESLQKELEDREESFWTALAKTPAQRDLHRLDRDLALVGGLLNLTLTPAEWGHYQERRNEIHQIPLRLAEGPQPMDFGPFEGFYEAAESRNQALVKNTLAALSHSPAGTPVLLVAGGFHSAGVSRLFSDQNIGWVTVAPRFSTAAEAPGGAFAPGAFGLFYRDRTPLELLFDSPRVTLSETLTLGPLTEEGASRARALADLSFPLREALDSLHPAGTRWISSGKNVVVVRDSSFPDPWVEGARSLVANVPAGIGSHRANAPLVSVFHLRTSLCRRIWDRLGKRAFKILGVALLGMVLLPFSGMPEAQAYSLMSGPQGVQVVVQNGEHLWGAATHALKARGVEKPSNAQISRVAKEIAEQNGIKNPNRIQPGVPYRLVEERKPISQIGPTWPPPPEAERATSQTEPETKAAAKPTGESPVKGSPGKVSEFVPSLLWGIVVAFGIPGLVSVLCSGRVRPRLNILAAAGHVLSKISPVQKRTTLFGAFVFGGMSSLCWILADGIPPSTAEQFVWFLATQWPVELALSLGLVGAVYFIWFRPKEINLLPIEQNEPRLREWGVLLERMKNTKGLSEEDVSRLVNNLHSLILNNRITVPAVSDRGVLEKRIDIYRALSRLSHKTVLFLDQRLAKGDLLNGEAARVRDVREKFFLYELYGLKVSNALLPASVTHWALSNFERQDSWFEQRKVGALLRVVRGVPSMIRGSVREYTARLLQDDSRSGKTLWDQAEGLSVVSLGNVLSPGLYSETDKIGLAAVFSVLAEKAKTKELPDMSAKDLHRKGWGTLTSLLIWGVAMSQMMSFFPALLAFVTGLGVTMVLFRFQALGVRRDGFFRAAIEQWRDMNRRPHSNGRMNGNGVGEDPFHLNRDFARHHFEAAEEGLVSEMAGAQPSADVILLIAQNASEQAYFEKKVQDRALFREDVPVVILTVPAGRGSFYAYARAWTYLFSDEFQSQQNRFPHLRGRSPWDLGVVTLVSKTGWVKGLSKPLKELSVLESRLGAEALGHRTLFDLALMNAYRATQAGRHLGQGGFVLRWADRAYVGPVRVPRGQGVCLETQWANRHDMARYHFGAVIASLDKPIELIRRSKIGKTLKNLVKEHPTRVYDLHNDRLKQVQSFSGEGVYVFDSVGARAQAMFLADVLKRADDINGTAPPLNLMTYYLVPMAIAQGNPREISRRISVYFSGQGFLTDPLPRKIQRFNHASANALASVFENGGFPRLSLNAGFVDETIYAGADEEDPSPATPAPNDLPAARVRVEKVAALQEGIESILKAVQAKGVSNPFLKQELRNFLMEATSEIPLTGDVTESFNLAEVRAKLKNVLGTEEGVRRAAPPAEKRTTVLRVTELLEGGVEHRRTVLLAEIKQRADRWTPAQEPDLLLVNGEGPTEPERVRHILLRSFSPSPRLDAYLSACRVGRIEGDRFTPDQVRALLSPKKEGGRSLDIYTADPFAVVVDPRADLSCRVLLLEWVDGELRTLDLVGLARAALELARVVATKA